MWCVGEVAKIVYGTALRGASMIADEGTRNNLRGLLMHMAPYFPFGDNAITMLDVKTSTAMQNLNLAYCELMSMMVVSEETATPHRNTSSKGKAKAKVLDAALSSQIEKVGEYVVRSLRGEVSTPGRPLGQPISATSYLALLPTIWSLLDHRQGTVSPNTVAALLEHSTRTGSASSVKRLAIEFVGRLILLEAEKQYKGRLRLTTTLPHAVKLEALRDWVIGLPRVLWEFGATDPRGTEVILLLLLKMVQRRTTAILDASTLASLRQRLVPFFNINHPTRGAVAGPWTKLSPALQTLTIDLAFSLLQPSGRVAIMEVQTVGLADLRASVATVLRRDEHAAVRTYWTGLVDGDV